MNPPVVPLPRFERLLEIGASLSAERDINKLLTLILDAAQCLANADGATLYQVSGSLLNFAIMRNTTLKIKAGESTGVSVVLPPLPLFQTGKPVLSKVATYCVHTNRTVNIDDVYAAEGFDFSGTKTIDAVLKYRSKSMLAVPMQNHEGEIIGVLQLINAQDPSTGEIIPFSSQDQRLVESLASQAAMALTNRMLIKQLEALFEAFISTVNKTIDDKSPYTAGHCARVPELTMLIAKAVNKVDYGPLKDFSMTDRDVYELEIAGLLHDCGKITTPVHVVDKSTKLQTIFDRIDLIDTRFEVLRRDLENACLKGEFSQEELSLKLEQLESDRTFIRQANIGCELMDQNDISRVKEIAKRYSWMTPERHKADFLNEDEVSNLTVRMGTLTDEERRIINHHIEVTIEMLEQLPWPKHLRNVPEYAGGHHEHMDGTGYPRGLTRDQMSVQARCMGIADVFEALTARDRPYKKGMSLTQALRILGGMKLNNHIDPDIFNIFMWEKVYEDYARKHLTPEQIDEVDPTNIPGYETPPGSLC